MRLRQRAYMYSKFEKSKSRTASTCRPQMPLFTTKASKRSSFVFNVKSEAHTAYYFSIAPSMALSRFRKMSRGLDKWTDVKAEGSLAVDMRDGNFLEVVQQPGRGSACASRSDQKRFLDVQKQSVQ